MDAVEAAKSAKALLAALLETLPSDCREMPAYRQARAALQEPSLRVYDVIYDDKPCQRYYKTFDFSWPQVAAHWSNGARTMQAALRRDEALLRLVRESKTAPVAA